jgi:hypothetical protein
MSQISPREGISEAAVAVDSRSHVHTAVAFRRKAKVSLLQLSAFERLAGVFVLLCGLWMMVFWALH